MIEPDVLRALLHYDPETGGLTWKPRSRDMFSRRRLWLSWNTRFAGKPAFRNKSNGYWRGTLLHRVWPSHRVIWAIHYGRWPAGVIDHINGDTLDNRIENLRCVTQAANLRNAGVRRQPNASGVVGVYPSGKRWDVRVGRGPSIGIFDTIEEATAAREAGLKARGYHPNHGRLLNTRPVPSFERETYPQALDDLGRELAYPLCPAGSDRAPFHSSFDSAGGATKHA